jgi:hypothetical protein
LRSKCSFRISLSAQSFGVECNVDRELKASHFLLIYLLETWSFGVKQLYSRRRDQNIEDYQIKRHMIPLLSPKSYLFHTVGSISESEYMHDSRSGGEVPDANPTFVFEMLLIGQTRSEKILAEHPAAGKGSRDCVRGFAPTKSMPPVNLHFTGNGFNGSNAGHQS